MTLQFTDIDFKRGWINLNADDIGCKFYKKFIYFNLFLRLYC